MLNSIKTKAGCTLLERMIGIVHELGYSVLCEGIETQEQLDCCGIWGVTKDRASFCKTDADE